MWDLLTEAGGKFDKLVLTLSFSLSVFPPPSVYKSQILNGMIIKLYAATDQSEENEKYTF